MKTSCTTEVDQSLAGFEQLKLVSATFAIRDASRSLEEALNRCKRINERKVKNPVD